MEEWEVANYPFECLIRWPDYEEEVHPDDEKFRLDMQDMHYLFNGLHIHENIEIQHTWEGHQKIIKHWSNVFDEVQKNVSNQLIGFTSVGADLQELYRQYAGIDELDRATKARKKNKISRDEKERRKKQQELDKKKPNQSAFPKRKHLPGR